MYQLKFFVAVIASIFQILLRDSRIKSDFKLDHLGLALSLPAKSWPLHRKVKITAGKTFGLRFRFKLKNRQNKTSVMQLTILKIRDINSIV